jgi:hypothetical protein
MPKRNIIFYKVIIIAFLPYGKEVVSSYKTIDDNVSISYFRCALLTVPPGWYTCTTKVG